MRQTRVVIRPVYQTTAPTTLIPRTIKWLLITSFVLAVGLLVVALSGAYTPYRSRTLLNAILALAEIAIISNHLNIHFTAKKHARSIALSPYADPYLGYL